jgi:uncharacterized phiE125 gp8 family phage protein
MYEWFWKTPKRYTLTQVLRPIEINAPIEEPISLEEARDHLNIANDDNTYDTMVSSLIQAARLKWENDTQEYLISRGMQLVLENFCEFQFPHRPVTSISSVEYYDAENVLQTLDATNYQLDVYEAVFRQAYNQSWPVTVDRWDAITIKYTLGSHFDSTTVPEIAKSAMKLLIGFYFENRDMLAPENMQSTKPYDHLVHNYMRSSYP